MRILGLKKKQRREDDLIDVLKRDVIDSIIDRDHDRMETATAALEKVWRDHESAAAFYEECSTLEERVAAVDDADRIELMQVVQERDEFWDVTGGVRRLIVKFDDSVLSTADGERSRIALRRFAVLHPARVYLRTIPVQEFISLERRFEDLLNEHSVHRTLDAFAQVAAERAERYRVDNDHVTAAQWQRLSKLLDGAANDPMIRHIK